jgi:hypothetical protein
MELWDNNLGKRSNFDRVDRDFYKTPHAAVLPLIPHLEKGSTFLEPCAGDGALINHLEDFGMICKDAYDLLPQRQDIKQSNALTETFDVSDIGYIITNPPWQRELLNPMIDKFMKLRPTWLLFDLDWACTTQEKISKKTGCPTVPELMKHCEKIVVIGRVKWIPNSKSIGKENAAWYLFDINHTTGPKFYPKVK